MKRLALLLGSLLVVSAAASAKEVVPAPVVVEEVPVQIVEKEVIVYRDRAPEWRPTGSVDLSQEYYGKTEDQKRALDNGTNWNENNKYTRTVLQGEVALTENQKMDFRTRWYQSVDHRANNSKNNDLRLRYYYNHGELMGVPATTRLQYEKEVNGANSLEYRMEFDFAKYFFNNDYVKTTSAVIAPTYKYTWDQQASRKADEPSKIADAKTAYTNTLGLYANFVNQLPYGFGFELEFDGLNFSKHHGDSPEYWNGNSWQSKDKEFVATINAKLTHGWNLYSEGDLSVDWAFEGGYDSYELSNLRKYSTIEGTRGERAKYSLMAKPEVAVNYAATKFVNLYAKVGAEYRNWTIEAQSEASHWRWQPYATVGVKTTF